MSVSRYAGIWKDSEGSWWLDLAPNEYDEYEDAITYGPFSSKQRADDYLSNNFSNPGSIWIDRDGDQPPPTESPNGDPIVRPGKARRPLLMGGYRRGF